MTNIEKKKDLIAWYERKLSIVRRMYVISESNTSLQNDRAKMYITNAEQQLDEVKNGREW